MKEERRLLQFPKKVVQGFANEVFDEMPDIQIAGESLVERTRALFLESLAGLAAAGGTA